MNKDVIIDMPMTGVVNIDLVKAASQWNDKCLITQYKASFRLHSEELKLTISAADAEYLINEIPLTPKTSDFIRFAITWTKIPF